jgi:hypothetical protein
MNVLILTPDAVGSTLLQRMLTVYMQFHEFDRPVINLHELTNGLAKYYSPEFKQEIVSKKEVKHWGYFQTLQQVVELLSSVDHYKTSRLAHYHLIRRGDTLEQQIPFYNYLNENFYIIACQRSNVFEHALSLTLSAVTKKLNVYDHYEKIETYYDIYKDGITLDKTVFLNRLNDYKLYLDWSQRYFNIASYFNYEQDVPRLEDFILGLPVFSGQQQRVSWDKNFGMSFNSWNKINYVASDLGSLMLEQSRDLLEQQIIANSNHLLDYQQHAYPSWPAVLTNSDIENLPADIKQQWQLDIIRRDGITSLLSQSQQNELAQYNQSYYQAKDAIGKMIEQGVMVSGPPIKKQTLLEKSQIVTNFAELIEIYNNWAVDNPNIATPMDANGFATDVMRELDFWRSPIGSTSVAHDLLPNQQ